MAYLVVVPRPKCQDCPARAVKQLINWVNAPLGYYCGRCAPKALKAQQEREAAAALQHPSA